MKCSFAILLIATVGLATTFGSTEAEQKIADTYAAVAALEKLMTPEQKELGGPIVNSVDIVLVPIPAGEFMMGSPETEEGRQSHETQHLVRITKPFYLSAYEVTQAQYQRVMGENPAFSEGVTKPVGKVSWDDAVEFFRKLSERESVEYRLPTEAEWEYACRAGTTTAYSFGNDASELGEYAWHHGNSGHTTHPVGEKLPNGWGLFDMHGNIWEWCHDWYGRYETEQVLIDPSGTALSSGNVLLSRVLRGGAFAHPTRNVRAASRFGDRPDYRFLGVGFRMARTYDLSPAGTGPTVDNPGTPPENAPTTEESVAAPEKLGAKIKRNEQGDIVEVSLSNKKDVTDAGLVHLTGLTKLEALNLINTDITDAGLVYLKALSGLEKLSLFGTKVTRAGVAELQKALPACRITIRR